MSIPLTMPDGSCSEYESLELLLWCEGPPAGFLAIISSVGDDSSGTLRLYMLATVLHEIGVLGDNPTLVDSLSFDDGVPAIQSLRFERGTRFVMLDGGIAQLALHDGTLLTAIDRPTEDYRLHSGHDYRPVCLTHPEVLGLSHARRLHNALIVLLRNREESWNPFYEPACVDRRELVDGLVEAAQALLPAGVDASKLGVG